MPKILEKRKELLSVLIFLLLIFLSYSKQGDLKYNISIILIFLLNLFLMDLNWCKSCLKNFFKKRTNVIFLIFLVIFFSRNFYSFQIFVSSILAILLFLNFKKLKESFKIKLVYFFSILSILNYYFLGFFLIDYSNNSYLFSYDTISHLNSYDIFKGINFHNISVLFLGILFLKIKYFKFCTTNFKNILIISIAHDFLFFLNLGYYSILIFFFTIILISYFVDFLKFKSDRILFFLVILFSLNFLLSPLVLNKTIPLNFVTAFENINLFLNFLEYQIFESVNGNNKLLSLEELKLSVGNDFIPFLGIINRIIFYWSPSNFDISIFGINNYDNFIFHSLFLEFLSNFGLIGLITLYFYLYYFFSIIDTKNSKLFFLIIVALNSMDTFIFTHHYQLMIMSWIFIGLLDEKKKI